MKEPSHGPEPCASANSATGAHIKLFNCILATDYKSYYIIKGRLCLVKIVLKVKKVV